MIGEIKGKVCVGIYDLKFNLYDVFLIYEVLYLFDIMYEDWTICIHLTNSLWVALYVV